MKTNRIHLFIALAGLLTASLAAPVRAALIANSFSPANLQGYWQFDETNDDPAPLNSATPDQSGNSRNGTYETSAGRLTDGSFSPAILGAGNKVLSTLNDGSGAVEVPEPGTPSVFGIGGAFSVAFWVKPAAQGGIGTFLSMQDIGNSKGWRIGYNPAFNRLFVQQNGSFIFLDNTITPGQWTHLVYTFDGTTGNIYENGNTTPIISGALPLPLDPNRPFIVGGQYGNAFDSMLGQLDETAIWNTALSSAQVGSLYNAYLPEPASVSLLAIGGLMVMGRRKK
jgi:hypothetical protein